jgi:(p)ppGpp synthase/HD superfamily hydrolase
MPLTSDDRARLHRATDFALEWHAEQHRKGTEIPYLSHLLQVAGLVIEHGGSVDQAVAALLHDSLEDAESPDERRMREASIAREFGDGVLEVVLACSDTRPDEAQTTKGPWKERKLRYLEQLRSADAACLLVAACDKHHNLHSLVWDIESQGRGYLARFTGSPADQVWYFESVLAVVGGRVPRRLEMELYELLGRFRKQIEET